MIVSSITLGPVKPIRAFGSARFTSPSIEWDAVVPPVVGFVRTEINGIEASWSLASAVEVLAICINE